jgi:LSD1 subclass zinc finger protein
MARLKSPWGPPRAAPAPPVIDDDPLPETAQPVSQYPCGSCGAILSYRPGEHTLHCEFCGADTPIPVADRGAMEAAVREHDYRAALENLASGAPTEITRVAHCDACGAEVEFEPNVHSAECPFCATPLVTDTTEDRHIKPQGLLPFAIDREAARQALRRWLASRWFAPNGLKKYARTNNRINGIYTPYWTFDARTQSAYAGRRGDAYTVQVRGPDGKPQTQTRIRWRNVSGRVARDFDDVLVLGATSLPESDTDALQPWDLSQLQPYSRDYLAGFRAESYTVPLDRGFSVARGKMDEQIRFDVRRAIGGDQQQITRLDTRVWDVTFKHILLPVWVAAYRYRGKPYRVVINGRTGAVRGQRPYSIWKIALALLLAAAVAAAVFVAAEGGGLR